MASGGPKSQHKHECGAHASPCRHRVPAVSGGSADSSTQRWKRSSDSSQSSCIPAWGGREGGCNLGGREGSGGREAVLWRQLPRQRGAHTLRIVASTASTRLLPIRQHRAARRKVHPGRHAPSRPRMRKRRRSPASTQVSSVSCDQCRTRDGSGFGSLPKGGAASRTRRASQGRQSLWASMQRR